MGEGHGLEPLDVDRLFRFMGDTPGWGEGLSGDIKASGLRASGLGSPRQS